jgi:two-component system, NtrC family, sensor kinase
MKKAVFIIGLSLYLYPLLGQKTDSLRHTEGAFLTLKKEADSLQAYIGGGSEIPTLQTVERLKSLWKRTNNSKFNKLEEQILMLLGLEYQHLGQHKEAEKYYLESIRVLRASPNADSLLVAYRLAQLGRLFIYEEKYAQALQHILPSLRLREQFKAPNTMLAQSYTLVGMAYTEMGDLVAAEKNLNRALQIKMAGNDTATLGLVYLPLSEVYYKQKRYQEAEKHLVFYLNRRLATKNQESIMDVYRLLADMYDDWGKFAEAETYYLKGLEVIRKIQRRRPEGQILLKLANLYERFGYTDKARHSLEQASRVSGTTQIIALKGKTFLNLSQLNAHAKNYELAYTYLNRYVAYRDSLGNEEAQKKLSELRTKFEVEQKEREIAELDRQNKQQLRERNYLIFSLLGLSLLTLVVIYFYLARRKAANKLEQEKQHAQSLLEEKEKLLNDLHAAQVQLIHSEKMASLGLLTAGIAHEINNPVSFINASMSALKMDFLELNPIRKKLLALPQSNNLAADVQPILADMAAINAEYVFEEMGQLMQSIEKGTLRTTEIVAGLRAFSRDTGDVFVPTNLNDGLDSALALLGHKITEGVILEKNYGDLPPVLCQSSRLNQVFLNLLDNAIYAIKGGGTIRIDTFATAENAYIVIKDTGKGMDLATQKHLFEPFYTTKEVGEGTGLGLSISYAIIQQHKGLIEVESALGAGSVFRIVLPLSQ